MGIFSFIKDAGEKLFGANTAEAAADKVSAINAKLSEYNVSGVHVNVEDDTVTLSGTVASIKDVKKAIIIAGNIEGVASVSNQLRIQQVDVASTEEPVTPEINVEKSFYTVEKGDSLSKIALAVYGDAMKYPVIFEANKPMLSHPDKIYPGQTLIIPELDK